ncbi:AraC family transcriptional regulator [Nocardia asteroides]|uniref:AraC family transcriptional regulator n=1 Tax=Nocardia asteroides TaxID=1824 RepID=UPI0004BFA671|nr:AraC family transcriptional regulator [Nocardia asteroides]UGT46250.1 AraC family transcriptional regulator ligand-binding domain-containing protein [Nocardia asteroides]SFM97269.1 transcriptional regulator, AraC family [Nocardia asteroides]VEG34951.1 Colonization factor antigen I subunit D [Nocardia asteroides]
MRLDSPTIPPAVLTGVVEIGQREGRDTAAWFAGTGLDVTQLLTAATVKVSFRQAADVLRRALDDMPDRSLGMQVGGRDMLLSMGMLGVAMRSCATVAEALAVGLELHEASGSLMDLEVENLGREVALRMRERWPEPRLLRFLCEEAIASTVVFLRSVFGREWSPLRVDLAYAPPPYVKQYYGFFRCPIVFSASASRLVLPAAELALPFPTRSEQTRTIAVEACRRLLDIGRQGPTITTAVETVLERDLRSGLTMAQVAAHLHVTERTLRRQLATEDASFSDLRDRVRERRARFLLQESDLTIGGIAQEVGYSDLREFRRAYIRWTGHPPSAARRAADRDRGPLTGR